MEWLLTAFILGAVEGLTEFLPVSSTGHLIIFGHILGFTGDVASVFEVAIQFGAILAVVVLYKERFLSLCSGLLHPHIKSYTNEGLHGFRGIWLLFLTTLPPSIAGLLLHDHIKALFTPFSVALALAVGAVLMLIIEHYAGKKQGTIKTLDDITPRLALSIGFCQCLALWAGFSRSASTIMGGMIFGATRGVAAEYSFIAAVPLMTAATGYDVLKNWHLFQTSDIPLFAAGMVFSFIFAWLAVKTFIALMGKLTLRPFAYYRLLLAPIVYFFLVG